MDVNESIVEILESIGVDHVFGGSGQVNASMLLALEHSKKIKTIIVKNEQAASFMACGYSMFSDKLGVCFATGGPGAFNLFSGMAVAYSDSLPLLAITGYTSASIRGKGALNEASGLSRTPDSHKMFAATTKKSYILEDPDQLCNVLEEAINLAFEGRPGPVHIHIPKDITVKAVNNFRKIKLEVKPVYPKEDEAQPICEVIAETLKNGRQIALLAGYGAVRSHCGKEILEFAEKYQIPVMTTMDGKGVFPENHSLSLGVFGSSGDPGANRCFEKADVVIALGNSFAENATFAFRKELFAGKILIHINIDKHEIDKVYKSDFHLVSDAKYAMIKLIKELGTRTLNIDKKVVARDKYYDKKLEYSGIKIHPGELAQAISQNLPPNSILMGDAGAHMLWLNCYISLSEGQLYQNPGSFGPMASSVNGAMGVKCADPDKTVVCACGDGDYLMAGFELLTAVENNIPVVWVIFNNSEFNIIKKFLLNLYGKHAYMQFKNPDYVLYAEACGAKGYRVTNLKDFRKVFRDAIASNRPVIIDAVVESDIYPPFGLAKV